MADGAGSSLRIVHVLTRFLRAGSEENTVATALWQADAGHDVTILHGGQADPAWSDILRGRVRVTALPDLIHPIRPLADMAATWALRRQYRALAPQIIHTHQTKAGILGRQAADAVPAALVVHGIHILPFANVGRVTARAYLAAERHAARRTDLLIAVSDSLAQAYATARIAPPDRLAVVRSGMDLATFRTARPPPDAAALSRGRPVILMLAAFEPRKRHVDFLHSIAPVIAASPGVTLLLAGAGPTEGAARATVARLGLSDHVTFCGHRPDPAALIAMADLTVLTSSREGLPRVVVQSIAAGCPVVVTRLPGIEEVVTDGHNGCITDPLDLTQTASTIRALLSDRPRLDRLRRGAQATDISAWSLDRLGQDTTALCLAALGRKGRA